MSVKVHCVYQNGLVWSLLVILRSLYKLAVNDKLRTFMYFEHSIVDASLCSFLKRGNEIEKKYTLRLLCQLSFNARIADEMQRNSELMKLMNKCESS